VDLRLDRGNVSVIAILALISAIVSAALSGPGRSLPFVSAINARLGIPVADALFFVAWVIAATAWYARWFIYQPAPPPPLPPPSPPRERHKPFVPKGNEEDYR
jgi:hypothetical protein